MMRGSTGHTGCCTGSHCTGMYIAFTTGANTAHECLFAYQTISTLSFTALSISPPLDRECQTHVLPRACCTLSKQRVNFMSTHVWQGFYRAITLK